MGQRETAGNGAIDRMLTVLNTVKNSSVDAGFVKSMTDLLSKGWQAAGNGRQRTPAGESFCRRYHDCTGTVCPRRSNEAFCPSWLVREMSRPGGAMLGLRTGTASSGKLAGDCLSTRAAGPTLRSAGQNSTRVDN